jgi:dolichyl-phosphate beta-glucosyltransferase
MPVPPDLSIVIPAFNEEARLGPTLRDIVGYLDGRGLGAEVIVVDDGSTDGTSELVTRLSEELPAVRLLRLARNRGKGYAVRSGVLNARGRFVLFADADGATPIGEIERLEEALDRGADIAIGSRALRRAGIRVRAKLYRRVIGRAFHGLVSVVTVKGIADTQCGFKMFRGDVAHDLFARLRMDGFSFDVELLLTAQLRGYEVAEVPVNWYHQPGSRVNLVLDSLRMARDLFVIRANVFRGQYDAPHLAPMPVALAGDRLPT